MRTRTTTAGILAAVALTLTACSSSDDSDQADTKPSPSVTISKETQYITAARDITFNGTPSDEELYAYPPQWCEALQSGHSVQWMFDMTGGGSLYPIGMEWGTAKADAHELLVVGVRAYCPKHLSAVQDELRSTGEY